MQEIDIRFIYLIMYVLAFGVGLYIYKYHKALKILVFLLAFGIFTEYIVSILIRFFNIENEEFIYNFYVPIEYFLYAAFFYYISDNKNLRKAIIISIPVFVISILLFTEAESIFSKILQTNIYVLSGIFTIIWSLWTLFTVKPIKKVKFRAHPLFWICTGLIVFYSVNTPFNLLYDILKKTDEDLFNLVSKIVQRGSNIFLYTFFIIGFICSHRMKK